MSLALPGGRPPFFIFEKCKKMFTGYIGGLAAILLIIITLTTLALVVYLYVSLQNAKTSFNNSIAEMKSKIGNIISQFNKFIKVEYNIDASQQRDINTLKTNYGA